MRVRRRAHKTAVRSPCITGPFGMASSSSIEVRFGAIREPDDDVVDEFPPKSLGHRLGRWDMLDERTKATDDILPEVLNHVRIMPQHDAVNREAEGDRGVPRGLGILIHIVRTIPDDVDHGAGGPEGRGQEQG